MATIVMTEAQLRDFGFNLLRAYELSRRNGNQVTEDGELLTTEEACQRLKVSRATLDRMSERGDIARRKVSGCWRYEANSIEKYFDDQRKK